MLEKNSEKLEKEQGLQDEFMSVTREIAVRAKNIRENLAKIKDVKRHKKEDQIKDLNSIIAEVKHTIEIKEGEITHSLSHAREIFKRDDSDPVLWAKARALGDDYGDQIARIGDKWDEFKHLWKEFKTDIPKTDEEGKKIDTGIDVEALYPNIDELDKILCSIITHSNVVTIPSRLNECLKSKWPGQSLNFYDQFKDELCREDCVDWFLKYIDSQSKDISGIVDYDNKAVISASTDKRRQVLSLIFAGLLILGGAIIAYFTAVMLITMNYPLSLTAPNMTISSGVTTTFDFSKLTPSQTKDLPNIFVFCYFFILVGSVAHILIGLLKKQRASKGGSSLPIEGWLQWFNVYELKNFYSIICLWVGFFGLILVVKTADYLTALLVGYSIDSFIGLFLDRFEQSVSSKTDQLKATITPNKEG